MLFINVGGALLSDTHGKGLQHVCFDLANVSKNPNAVLPKSVELGIYNHLPAFL